MRPAVKTDPRQNISGLAELVEPSFQAYFQSLNGHRPAPNFYEQVLQEIELPLIRTALRITKGNKGKAADLLGINRNTLRKKIQALKIEGVDYA